MPRFLIQLNGTKFPQNWKQSHVRRLPGEVADTLARRPINDPKHLRSILDVGFSPWFIEECVKWYRPGQVVQFIVSQS